MRRNEKFRSLISMLIFLVPLMVISLLLTRLSIRIQYPDTLNIPQDTEILILGDSHAVCALDPEIIGKAFNFSNSGESYIHNYYKLKWFLKRQHSLKTIILPIDLHSFSDFRKDRIHFNLNWLRYLNYPELGWIKKRILDYTLKYIDMRFFGFKGQYRQFMNEMFKSPSISKSRANEKPGFKPREGYFFHNRTEKARKRASRQLKGFDVYNREMVFFFKRILKLCQSKQLRVILLRLPISEDYYIQALKLTDVLALEARMLRLAQQFPSAIILDFRKVFFKQEAGLFWDPQHLNAIGARDLSTRVQKRMIQHGIIKLQY